MKIDRKNDKGTRSDSVTGSSRPTPADLPPLRRVTVADIQKVEALMRARRTAGIGALTGEFKPSY